VNRKSRSCRVRERVLVRRKGKKKGAPLAIKSRVGWFLFRGSREGGYWWRTIGRCGPKTSRAVGGKQRCYLSGRNTKGKGRHVREQRFCTPPSSVHGDLANWGCTHKGLRSARIALTVTKSCIQRTAKLIPSRISLPSQAQRRLVY